MHGWKVAGRACVALGWVLWVVIQAVSGDVFPPEISVSQYGVGDDGWIFSIWCVVVSAGPILLWLARPVPGSSIYWLATGWVGALIMALIRTDPGGLQESMQAKIHTFGAVLNMIALPVGMLLVLRLARPLWRNLALTLGAVDVVAGTLLLLAAAGYDTAGLGPASSWAFWQAVAISIDLLLTAIYAIAVDTVRPRGRTVGPGDGAADRLGTGSGRGKKPQRS